MAEENPGESFTLNSLNFIMYRPWIIISSFLILFNAFQAYSATIPALYSASASLLFESALVATNNNIINEKKSAAEAILTGSNMEPILESVVEDRPEMEREAAFSRLRSKLMSGRTGLQFRWEDKSIGSVLNIYFEYDNASDCYKTVKAAMNMMMEESEKKFTGKMEANLSFLKNQLKFYKDKISEIETESEDIKRGLMERYSELSPAEQEEVSKISAGAKVSETEDSAGKDLAGLRSKREELKRSLDDGTFITRKMITDIEAEDLFLKEYEKTADAKEMEIDSLLSRGYKEGHPQVRQLREEIDREKEIRKMRLARLIPEKIDPSDYEAARQNVILRIKELDMRIGLITNNFKAAAPASTPAKKGMVKLRRGPGVKELIARLSNLASEKAVNEGYYQEMRKNLGNAELKYRTENEAAGFKISVFGEPGLPTRPDFSKSRKAALNSFMLALLMALGIGFAAHRMKGAVYSTHELENILGIPVIATIDNITSRSEMKAKALHFKHMAAAVVVVLIATRVLIAVIHSLGIL